MTYFFSDVHLGYYIRSADRRREDMLIQFLEHISQDAEKIYIVGDLFDYWFEYNTVIPKYFYRSVAAMERIVRSGTKIEYLMGNHDFGHQRFFAEEIGITIERGDIECEIGNKRFFIAHGDGKVKNDGGYLILRAILRNKLSIKLFQWLHPDVGIWLASRSSRASRRYTDAKEFGTEDGLSEFAAKKITEGFDYVIMGHRHHAGKYRLGNGWYLNLGHWLGNAPPTYARFDGSDVELLDYTR
ncbi:UDP-2,3-diacylglucosamine diphosphatase [Ignavibacteria bacterium]|nr:UDP-2,3-diacylglucosamine diphosphatase [Bacteroidota bacterium]MCZ2132308.1 UDP-2,3-diacylglucosamine diphosphatase [Bacteroidota bacterium]